SKRSPISIANGVLYISNFTGDTEFAFDAASGARLWRVTLPGHGVIGTVIANGMVYVSSYDGTISAWAPSPAAEKLRRRAVKRPAIVIPDNVSIPDGYGGTIDLRGSVSNFDPPDDR
ncbi:MAG: PQQ-like beta-propeller repeat protein, partial [Candidatus Eremiobacteraeota bacterium]|nr:PQQ-like beta-propeller repeat protein [Candidatus Eremiobacteraeota bacterium]